jgi:Leucine-rich repeat (LRR) protein
LVLSDNSISSVPVGLSQVTSLRKLYLDDNQLTEIPKALQAFLLELVALDLSNNSVELSLTSDITVYKEKGKKTKVQPSKGGKMNGIPSSIPRDKTAVFSDINLDDSDAEDSREMFKGERSYEYLESFDAEPNAQERMRRRANNTKLRTRETLRPSPKWGILVRELRKAGFLPKVNVKLPKLRKEKKKTKSRKNPSQITWRGWRVDVPRRPVITADDESKGVATQELDKYGHPVAITRLFPPVEVLEGVITLDMSLHKLEHFPVKLCQLKNLDILMLDYNKIHQLPQAIQNLNRLKALHFTSNELESLPENLRYLNELKILYLKDNKLSVLPEWLVSFLSLRFVSLENNKFICFPGELCSLHSLESLVVGGNNLVELPQEIRKLKRLRELYLGRNRLSHLPYSITELKNLKVLCLEENGLDAVPYSVFGILSLTTLQLEGNMIRSLPPDISALRNLVELDLSKNDIKELPYGFRQLENLNTLSLRANKIENFPEDLCKLPHLRSLDMSLNRITFLPDFVRYSISEMHEMLNLDLSFNRLTSLPKSVGKLVQLEIFHIEGNPLVGLPDTLVQLVNLQKLYLDKVLKIPIGVYRLKNLEIH